MTCDIIVDYTDASNLIVCLDDMRANFLTMETRALSHMFLNTALERIW